MPYGEMQLMAYGSQDLYLTGNPSITFFKAVYKRYTNFANEYIRQQFETSPSFQPMTRTLAKCKIDRNADLIGDIYLVYDLPNIYSTPEYQTNSTTSETDKDYIEVEPSTPAYFRWISHLGENIIYKVSMFVDGLLLDEQFGIWMDIWNELTLPIGKRKAYNNMTGNISNLNNPVNYNGSYEDQGTRASINAYRLYIPLQFWFCNNPGLAIPLISLQYNELYIHVEFNPLNNLFTVGKEPLSPSGIYDLEYINNFISDENLKYTQDLNSELSATNSENNLFWKFINGGISNGNSWSMNTFLEINYIFLDSDERKKFAQVSQEYLMTQIQTERFLINNLDEGLKGANNTLNLTLNNPVKELIWVLRRNDVDKRNQWNNYTTSLYDYDFNDDLNNFGNNFCSNEIYSGGGNNSNTYTPNYYKKIYYDRYLINNVFNSYNDLNSYYQSNPDTAFNQVNNIMYSAKLIFNGNDRFSTMDNNFFNYVQPYKYHTNTPSSGVNVYSFAIYPEEHQPSGTCNMSRITSVQLEIAIRWLEKNETWLKERNNDVLVNEGYELLLFGVNYNIFRIMAGMGGLVFAN